jgi:hypothetical protein
MNNMPAVPGNAAAITSRTPPYPVTSTQADHS